jgi:hypothetical protein
MAASLVSTVSGLPRAIVSRFGDPAHPASDGVGVPNDDNPGPNRKSRVDFSVASDPHADPSFGPAVELCEQGGTSAVDSLRAPSVRAA